MIGVGHNIWVEFWNGEELVSQGVLPPGVDTNSTFVDGPQMISRFVLLRLTNDEVKERERLTSAFAAIQAGASIPPERPSGAEATPNV